MRKTRYKVLSYDAERYDWDGQGQYMQWWYFDAEFTSGHRIMAFMLPRMVGMEEDYVNGPVPGVRLVIKGPDQKILNAKQLYGGRFEADPDRIRMSFGDNLIEVVDGRYHLVVHEGDLGIDLEYEPTLPPWPPLPGTGGFMFPPFLWVMVPFKYFNYASYVPRARVTGKLFMPDAPAGGIDVSGVGYHEQGRTNADLSGVFNYWYWNRIFIDDWTIIFPAGRSPASTLHAKMHALLIYKGNECVADLFDVAGLRLRSRITEYQTLEAARRDDVPRRCVFTARTRDLRMQVDMDLYQELIAFPWVHWTPGSKNLQQPAWMQHVMKVAVDMRWKGSKINLEGEGVFETMLTGCR
jgi:hypothetical protein